MGLHADIVGTIQISKDAGCSIRTLVENHFQTKCKYDQITNQDILTVKLSFSFCADGVDAAIQIHKFCEHIKQYDKRAFINMDASIRFCY